MAAHDRSNGNIGAFHERPMGGSWPVLWISRRSPMGGPGVTRRLILWANHGRLMRDPWLRKGVSVGEP